MQRIVKHLKKYELFGIISCALLFVIPVIVDASFLSECQLLLCLMLTISGALFFVNAECGLFQLLHSLLQF